MARSLLISLLAVATLTGAVEARASSGRVLALASDLEIDVEVAGDVVVLGGDLILEPGAVVHGDAVAIFGRVEHDPAARVDGRTIAIRSLATFDLEPVPGERSGHTRFAVVTLVMGGWLLATSLVAWVAPFKVQEGVRLLAHLGWRVAVLGVLTTVTYLAALLAALGLGTAWGVPLCGLLVTLFIAVKAVGLTVIGAALGRLILARARRVVLPTSIDVFAGVLVLVLLRVLPAVGGVVWTALSVVALGAGACSVIAMSLRVSGRVALRSP